MSESSESNSGVELAPGVWISASAMKWQYARSSGPGGQNVNKVNSKAELWLKVLEIRGLSDAAFGRLRASAGRNWTIEGELHLSSEMHRSQEMNRSEVMDKLREMLIRAKVEPKRRRKTKPSRASKERRLESKRVRSAHKANRRDVRE